MNDGIDELLALVSAPAPDAAWMPQNWADDVLAFWFGELQSVDWFKKSDATDTRIRERFGKLYAAVSRRPAAAESVTGSPREALAAVLVLDQFPRNIFRGHPQSFAADELARAIAEKAVAAGFDADMSTNERVFLYLPFEHSETLADQHRAVALISALGDAQYTKYAVAHRDVIERFGRFPHRNAILGRQSTPEEEAYLAEPGSGF